MWGMHHPATLYVYFFVFLFVCAWGGAGGRGVTVVIATSCFPPYNTRHESLWSIKYHNQNKMEIPFPLYHSYSLVRRLIYDRLGPQVKVWISSSYLNVGARTGEGNALKWIVR